MHPWESNCQECVLNWHEASALTKIWVTSNSVFSWGQLESWSFNKFLLTAFKRLPYYAFFLVSLVLPLLLEFLAEFLALISHYGSPEVHVVMYLHFGGSSFIRQYTGQMLNLEELNRATPSVFIWSETWTSFCFCSALVALKNPSFAKCLRYNCPSKMSSMLLSCFFFLVKRYWRRLYTSSPFG